MTGMLDVIAAVDWRDKPESTISSQLLMPLLVLLGYGEHTLHKVAEQRTFDLKDPTLSKGSRQIRIDYRPTVYEEGLWVMEAKGTGAELKPATLGQVRDYAIHPEIRAPLMVTVDSAGLRVFDPWDLHWDEPILAVDINEIARRFEEIREVLSVDTVPAFVVRRHLDHLRTALSASIDLAVLGHAQQEFQQVLKEAQASIQEKHVTIRRAAAAEREALAEQVERASGVWGAAQAQNSPWVGSRRDACSFEAAVLAQPEVQRPTQIMTARRAIEAVYRTWVPAPAEAFRPVWWIHMCRLASWPRLIGQPGCEPYATEAAEAALRDCLLGFPDEPTQAAAWRLQRVLIPLLYRKASGPALDKAGTDLYASQSAEAKLRFGFNADWLLGHSVRMRTIHSLAAVDPWTVEELDERAVAISEELAATPIPNGDWHGSLDDPWLLSWERIDRFQAVTMSLLTDTPKADSLIRADERLLAAVLAAPDGDDEFVSRFATPLADRLRSSDT
jgi:hypothetical protein